MQVAGRKTPAASMLVGSSSGRRRKAGPVDRYQLPLYSIPERIVHIPALPSPPSLLQTPFYLTPSYKVGKPSAYSLGAISSVMIRNVEKLTLCSMMRMFTT
uniref:Uncharacterized protein n=1 Tax=Rhodosorus marinus TaxID=101924 RepID=A0A7S0BNG0_9RHOD